MTLNSAETKTPLQIVVAGDKNDAAVNEQSEMLASHLGLDFVTDSTAEADLMLTYNNDGLVLVDLRDRQTRPMRIDFNKVDVRPYGANLSRRQPLARAMGKKNTSVIDATAGVGQDAFLLAAMGFEVHAIERNAVLAALLQDALKRAQSDANVVRALGGRMSVTSGDARKLILQRPPVDVIYLDPMFPPKRSKSALARKEMRLVRDLVGEDKDASQLFELAIARAGNRIVIKRPHHAKPLIPGPDFALAGKLVRYDIYLTHNVR